MNGKENMPEINYPITFNPWKHHFGFLRDQIRKWKNQDWDEVDNELLCIGNNLIDLYYGNLSVDIILRESNEYFREKGITSADKLEEWLHPLEYRKTVLSDNSLWIIKRGTDSRRFIHIHPAKNSPFSVRVRATTLKTIIALKIKADPEVNHDDIDLNTVNQIRISCLGLSPIKNLEKGKGISRLWNIFNDNF